MLVFFIPMWTLQGVPHHLEFENKWKRSVAQTSLKYMIESIYRTKYEEEFAYFNLPWPSQISKIFSERKLWNDTYLIYLIWYLIRKFESKYKEGVLLPQRGVLLFPAYNNFEQKLSFVPHAKRNFLSLRCFVPKSLSIHCNSYSRGTPPIVKCVYLCVIAKNERLLTYILFHGNLHASTNFLLSKIWKLVLCHGDPCHYIAKCEGSILHFIVGC